MVSLVVRSWYMLVIRQRKPTSSNGDIRRKCAFPYALLAPFSSFIIIYRKEYYNRWTSVVDTFYPIGELTLALYTKDSRAVFWRPIILYHPLRDKLSVWCLIQMLVENYKGKHIRETVIVSLQFSLINGVESSARRCTFQQSWINIWLALHPIEFT